MVILCHGFASHRNSFHFRSLAEALAQRQVGSLRIDFTGNGVCEHLKQRLVHGSAAVCSTATINFLMDFSYATDTAIP